MSLNGGFSFHTRVYSKNQRHSSPLKLWSSSGLYNYRRMILYSYIQAHIGRWSSWILHCCGLWNSIGKLHFKNALARQLTAPGFRPALLALHIRPTFETVWNEKFFYRFYSCTRIEITCWEYIKSSLSQLKSDWLSRLVDKIIFSQVRALFSTTMT